MKYNTHRVKILRFRLTIKFSLFYNNFFKKNQFQIFLKFLNFYTVFKLLIYHQKHIGSTIWII